MVKGVHTIRGRKYHDLERGYSHKSEAEYFAKELRKQGQKVIVVKRRGYWQLYGEV